MLKEVLKIVHMLTFLKKIIMNNSCAFKENNSFLLQQIIGEDGLTWLKKFLINKLSET